MANKILDFEGLKRLVYQIKDKFAPLASPTFTGVPKVPTASAGTATTQAASTAFVATGLASCASAADLSNLTTRVTTLENGGVTAAETIEQYVALYNGYMGTSIFYRDCLDDHTIGDVLAELDALNTAYFA